LGTDQFENGSPRSVGLESATSIKSRNCSARKIAGRPLGLVTRSKRAKTTFVEAMQLELTTIVP
jgi:hypothetical protein